MPRRSEVEEVREKLSDELVEELLQGDRVRVAQQTPLARINIQTTYRPNQDLVEYLQREYDAQVEYWSQVSRYVTIVLAKDEVPRLATEGFVKKLWHVPKAGLSDVAIEEVDRHVEPKETTSFYGVGDGVLPPTPVAVGVIDSGIGGHEVFEGKVEDAVSFVDDSPEDTLGHGSAVASQVLFMNPQARLHVAKVFTERTGDVGKAMQGIEWLALKGVPIVNMSWGTEEGYEPLTDLVRDVHNEFGTIFVTAAGNFGPSSGTIIDPASSPHALAVGSAGYDLPCRGCVAEFSSRGPTADGRVKPDIAGFGGTAEEGVVSAGTAAGEWKTWKGTSFASPQVAGLLSLLYPEHRTGAQEHLTLLGSSPSKRNDVGYGLPKLTREPMSREEGMEEKGEPAPMPGFPVDEALAAVLVTALFGALWWVRSG